MANADFGARYQVSEIQIDERDKYSPRAYRMMAYQMVEYAVEQGLVLPERVCLMRQTPSIAYVSSLRRLCANAQKDNVPGRPQPNHHSHRISYPLLRPP